MGEVKRELRVVHVEAGQTYTCRADEFPDLIYVSHQGGAS